MQYRTYDHQDYYFRDLIMIRFRPLFHCTAPSEDVSAQMETVYLALPNSCVMLLVWNPMAVFMLASSSITRTCSVHCNRSARSYLVESSRVCFRWFQDFYRMNSWSVQRFLIQNSVTANMISLLHQEISFQDHIEVVNTPTHIYGISW